MPAGNVKTTSEWSTVLLHKVRLRLAVWWQGKYRSSIFKQNFWNDKETYFSISVVNFLPPPPPPPLGKYAYPGWYDAAGNFVQCMWHVLYIDWFMYIYIISTTSLATHKSVWDYLFQCHARCMSCVTSIMAIPLRCQRSSEKGPGGPNRVWDPIYVCKHLADFCTNNI